MTDIFISYHSEDREVALELNALFVEEGWDTFIDIEGISAGEDYPSILDQRLKSAKAVVAIWTRKALTRPWVRRECLAALDRGILVPTAPRPLEPNDIPIAFAGVQYVRLQHDTGRLDAPSAEQLKAAIKRRIERGSPKYRSTPASNVDKDTPRPSKRRLATAAAGLTAAVLFVAATFAVIFWPTEPRPLPGSLESASTAGQARATPPWQSINSYDRSPVTKSDGDPLVQELRARYPGTALSVSAQETILQLIAEDKLTFEQASQLIQQMVGDSAGRKFDTISGYAEEVVADVPADGQGGPDFAGWTLAELEAFQLASAQRRALLREQYEEAAHLIREELPLFLASQNPETQVALVRALGYADDGRLPLQISLDQIENQLDAESRTTFTEIRPAISMVASIETRLLYDRLQEKYLVREMSMPR